MKHRVEQIGDATLYLGDCLEILPTLEKVDAVITDPPYASGTRMDTTRQVRGAMLRSLENADWFSHDAMTTWGFSWFMGGTLSTLRRKLSKGGHLYWFTDWRMTPTVYGMLEAHGYRVNHCLVWAKTHFGMGTYWRNQHENIVFASLGQPLTMLDRGRGSVVTIRNVAPSKREHPTEKPIELISSILSAIPGETVLDPFMGSGTTGVACANLNRKFIGIEIEQKYFDIACKRIDYAYKQGNLLSKQAASG
jgi:site-specific DNA-methyltransferase (adenine-specific)